VQFECAIGQLARAAVRPLDCLLWREGTVKRSRTVPGVLTVALAAALALSSGGGELSAQAAAVEAGTPDILLFTHVTCPYCADAKVWVEDLQRRMPGLTVRIRELSLDRQASADLQALARQVGVRSVSVPAWVIGGQVFMVGFGGPAVTGRQIERILNELGLPKKDGTAG
jgi:glutaredoxin